MKTIDEIIDIMHSQNSSDSAVHWAGTKFKNTDYETLYKK